MAYPIDKEYYTRKKSELLNKFEEDVKRWNPLLLKQYGEIQSYRMTQETRQAFENLIPQIPYIGGDENNFTRHLVNSVRYLALYKTMKEYGKTAEEAGKIIYNGYIKKASESQSPIPFSQRLTSEQRLEQNRQGAIRSQEKRYPGDYVYTFVEGDGRNFDYGLDFTECASQKLYHEHGTDEFLPYYCYLDFVAGKVRGFGFTRTTTIYEGHAKCNHRFKADEKTEADWPPPFLRGNKL
ncbi:MAG: L-2-amino-thiazoline-4-carboxylic acid hydrolase [Dehalococcoidales bacterium]|nr:L-2-amino-thiazoline-4-carboxylic acid hydrolase [Dehalococcoidales bacterium]